MRIPLITSTALLLAVALAGLSVPAGAERAARGSAAPGQSGWVLDQRHQHNHYYPPRGHVVPRVPPPAYRIPYRGSHYYYYGGVWYYPYGAYYSIVYPPFGVAVSVLPPYYTTVWYGGVPYYYAGGVYYVWRPEDRTYIVAEPPPEAEAREQPAVSDTLFIYPRKGQSAQQQATDRYECHRWSADQTGFDPTQPGGNVPESQHATKHADYQRALKTCLEGRNYSVR